MTPAEILGKTLNDELDPSYEQYETPLPNGVSNNIDTLVKQLKTYQPLLYKTFIPRVYEQTSAFMDWRAPGVTASVLYMAARQKPEDTLGWQAYVNYAAWSVHWEKYDNPCFFITPEFLKAMLNTGVPDNFDLSDFKLPFPALAFIMPKDNPLKFKGRPVPYIGIGRMQGGIETELAVITNTKALDKIVLTTSFLPKTFFAPGIRYSHLNEVVRMNVADFRKVGNQVDEAMSPVEDTEFVLLMLRLAVNLVLAMESRPELVSKEAYLRPSSGGKAGNYRPGIWKPNIVGARYRIVRETGDGTHASPRSHWRRGHFRRQRIGSALCSTLNCKHSAEAHITGGLCQLPDCKCERYTPSWTYKTIWVDPVLVNALAY
jgi:hypothetical protein